MTVAARACILVVTQKDTRIISLDDAHELALITVPINTSRREHAVQDRHHRADRPFQYSDAYFAEITKAIAEAPQLVLVGHGHGESNTAAGFRRYLQRIHPEIASRISAELSVDLSSRTPRQIAVLARQALHRDRDVHTNDHLDGVA